MVVGEASPQSEGSLRSTLEGHGVVVLGQAGRGSDLKRIITAAEPDVVVLDVQAGALTVLAVRKWAPRAGIVVVWPPEVLAEGADQHVELSRVSEDLVPAVYVAARMAARRYLARDPEPTPALDLLVIPEAADVEVDAQPVILEPIVPESVEPAQVPAAAAVAAAAAGTERVGSPVPPHRADGFRASVALVAACLALVLGAAVAVQPGAPTTGSLAQGGQPVPGQEPNPGGGGREGIGRAPRVGPAAPDSTGLAGSARLQVAPAPSSPAPTSTGPGGSSGTPTPRHVPRRRRHRRRHTRRHQRRSARDNGGHHGEGDGRGQSDNSHARSHGPSRHHAGSSNASRHDATHGNSDHSKADHSKADHGNSDHGNSDHGNSDHGNDD